MHRHESYKWGETIDDEGWCGVLPLMADPNTTDGCAGDIDSLLGTCPMGHSSGATRWRAPSSVCRGEGGVDGCIHYAAVAFHIQPLFVRPTFFSVARIAFE